jgi:ribulose-phosphate 3-epimerase
MDRIAPRLLSADVARPGDEVRAVIDGGADTFVAGSAIFGQPDGRALIDALRAPHAAADLKRAA